MMVVVAGTESVIVVVVAWVGHILLTINSPKLGVDSLSYFSLDQLVDL